jgi:hypothetical protein
VSSAPGNYLRSVPIGTLRFLAQIRDSSLTPRQGNPEAWHQGPADHSGLNFLVPRKMNPCQKDSSPVYSSRVHSGRRLVGESKIETTDFQTCRAQE